jgi:hypothetical protein
MTGVEAARKVGCHAFRLKLSNKGPSSSPGMSLAIPSPMKKNKTKTPPDMPLRRRK